MFLPYIKNLFFYVIVSAWAQATTYIVTFGIHGNKWFVFIVKAIICCIVPNAIFIIDYRKKWGFSESIKLINKITRGKISPLKTLE